MRISNRSLRGRHQELEVDCSPNHTRMIAELLLYVEGSGNMQDTPKLFQDFLHTSFLPCE